jgi:hypothetical protein
MLAQTTEKIVKDGSECFSRITLALLIRRQADPDLGLVGIVLKGMKTAVSDLLSGFLKCDRELKPSIRFFDV